MKLIINTIVCLLIACASNTLCTVSAYAEGEDQQIVSVPSSDANDKDTIYEEN